MAMHRYFLLTCCFLFAGLTSTQAQKVWSFFGTYGQSSFFRPEQSDKFRDFDHSFSLGLARTFNLGQAGIDLFAAYTSLGPKTNIYYESHPFIEQVKVKQQWNVMQFSLVPIVFFTASKKRFKFGLGPFAAVNLINYNAGGDIHFDGQGRDCKTLDMGLQSLIQYEISQPLGIAVIGRASSSMFPIFENENRNDSFFEKRSYNTFADLGLRWSFGTTK